MSGSNLIIVLCSIQPSKYCRICPPTSRKDWRHLMQQVFLNIVNNAYDAVKDTGRPPRIEVKTAHHGGVVEVAFRDNGTGITFPDRIFDPFFTTKEVGKGTGLGLSICYGIVREHGGEILCHNNAGLGGGATFIVRFPAASESASVGAAAGVTQR